MYYHNATTYKPNFMHYYVLRIIVRHDNRLPIDYTRAIILKLH